MVKKIFAMVILLFTHYSTYANVLPNLDCKHIYVENQSSRTIKVTLTYEKAPQFNRVFHLAPSAFQSIHLVTIHDCNENNQNSKIKCHAMRRQCHPTAHITAELIDTGTKIFSDTLPAGQMLTCTADACKILNQDA